MRYKLAVYQDKKKEWRWRFVAPNGRIVADSGEGYGERRQAVRMARRLGIIALFARIVAE